MKVQYITLEDSDEIKEDLRVRNIEIVRVQHTLDSKEKSLIIL